MAYISSYLFHIIIGIYNYNYSTKAVINGSVCCQFFYIFYFVTFTDRTHSVNKLKQRAKERKKEKKKRLFRKVGNYVGKKIKIASANTCPFEVGKTTSRRNYKCVICRTCCYENGRRENTKKYISIKM